MFDFFVWSKVLPLFLNPLPLILLVFLVISGILLWKKRIWVLVFGLTLILWVAATPWCADQLVRWWETPRKAQVELPPRSDVAIVLGGLSNPLSSTAEHLEFNGAAERLIEAVQLYRQGRVGAILITSGSGDLLQPGLAEAPELEAFALAWGVAKNDLVIESQSRNTHENGVLSDVLMKKRGWKSAVLVTSAWHMKRSQGVFVKAGYATGDRSLVTWPVDTLESRASFPFNAVPDPWALGTSQTILKEAVGWAVYAVQGYL